MKKTASILFVLALLGAVVFGYWKFSIQSNKDFSLNEFIESDITNVIEVNDQLCLQHLVNLDSDVRTKTIVSKTSKFLKSVRIDSIDELKSTFLFSNSNLELAYFEMKNIEKWSGRNSFKPNSNGLSFNGQYYARIGHNNVAISKKKARLVSNKDLIWKSNSNEYADVGITYLADSFVVDYYLEHSEIRQYKSRSGIEFKNQKSKFDLIRLVPKQRKSIEMYSGSGLNHLKRSVDSLWYTWLGNELVLLESEFGKLIIADYQGIFHPDELIEEWVSLSNTSDSNSISIGESKFFPIKLNVLNENFQQMKFVGKFDNAIIFSSDIESIKELVIAKKTGKVSSQDDLNWISDDSDYYKESLSPISEKGIFFESKKIVRSAGSNNRFYSSFIPIENIENEKTAVSLSNWEVKLKSKPIFGQFVTNHLEKENSFLIQDEQMKLTLYSNNGSTLWTYSLPSKIVGKVSIIDILGNNKKQMVFNTKNRLYILDMKGRVLSGFPVQIPNASIGVSPIDYDKTNNYRFLVGCEDGGVLNYSEKGKMVVGWDFQKQTSSIVGEIRHSLLGNKDYISITSKNGTHVLVGRNGVDRTIKKFEVGEKSIFQSGKTASTTRFYELKGTKIKINAYNGLNDSVNFDFPNFKFINGIKKGKSIYFTGVSSNELVFISNLGVEEIRIPIIDADIKNVELILDSNEEWKYFVVSDDKHIYLYDINGVLEDGYPIVATSKFWINQSENTTITRLVTFNKGILISSLIE